ncbi:MAG: dephospho-CoA kinase [Anaerolineae bacterium]|nr:MAG: dephospho-CoA kinase [Anaerolineae bacterium]
MDRYLIGLTGNIATGKSVVARMLAELGAHTIDADQVAHEVMRQGTPVWQAVVDAFGRAILAADGEIHRRRLGGIVFADPEALRRLEAIVHPATLQAVDAAVTRATERVVVVEAIKLVEAGMHRAYHALWVTACPPETQIARLITLRGLSEAEARLRVEAQPPQAEKVALADVVIDTGGTLADTRRQVVAAWEAIPQIFTSHQDKDTKVWKQAGR